MKWKKEEIKKIREVLTKAMMRISYELGSEYIISFEANFEKYPAFLNIRVKKW